ncbi:hypothetical protein JX265_012151 [Neoarthrinium moseri]|uniref:T6SS Phospholipase effector Tle1-like catalytic domain-containing protein n=1 Tax=Neoarthrinium moseri TaxID=1658444 RepID=A0A9Q0AJR9_9PEZI|nr:uncharacterized protein JN550_012906 [Neoarthrinium moseri]KAI1843276.1 hypothetical protein JX266_010630 [Neoarthrinium moseri]KAI1855706.1 hypothetical protein JX265_012151 [Neoarthrinium moseri]KAI1858013.1 hypothetical protein JN550_012906 [Neoarthrinium moseri]
MGDLGECPQEPKKLILCFDGTGNTFSGSNADTNVVKILNKLDRNDPHQYHYYQTGIGTYDINEKSVNKTWLGEMQSSISQTIDQGIGTTFDAHVIAGYRFLMRYYDSGDKIYMFGFSRGAFTAKFLTRMIHTVGLLCKGNEEMVPFAYRLYQRYLAGEIKDYQAAHPRAAGGASESSGTSDGDQILDGSAEDEHGEDYSMAQDEITAFSNTFCRKEKRPNSSGHVEETDIKVYFLGIWDCVNSVAVLEQNGPLPVPVKGTAQYVRHAVAVDERRVKFKAALLAQDLNGNGPNGENIKEVWFPGCHGDVGGGWPAIHADTTTDKAAASTEKPGWWQRIKSFWTTEKPQGASKDVRQDPFQMSDIPLAWMIRELELVGKEDPSAAVKWCKSVTGFKSRFNKTGKTQALNAPIHDSLLFGRGTGFFTVLLWKFMGRYSQFPSLTSRLTPELAEFLPIIKRWEIEKDQWVNVRFPLNKGATRDIPKTAVLHESLIWRLRNEASCYHPPNNHGGWGSPCLKPDSGPVDFELLDDGLDNPHHKTYKIRKND